MEPELFNWILAGLLGLAFLSVIAGSVLMRRAQLDARRVRQRALDGQVMLEEEEGGQSRLMYAIHRIGEVGSRGKFSHGLRRELIRAGYHGASAPVVYVGAKLALLAVGAAISAAVVLSIELPLPVRAFAALLTTALLFFLPNFVVARRRSKRAAEVQRHLPDAVDLLEICVSSGMGLDMAWNCVAGEIRRVSGLLADEMELTNLEINLGGARPDAMRHMAERTGSQDISSLVALLVQAERFGASIVDALATFAGSMREERSTRAEEAAEKMAVKLLFPMVLFIFPALLIVTVGPAVMQIVDVMG